MSPRKKKMKLYTVRIEMDDLCCPVWREVTIPSILVLSDVYRLILEAFGWDDESCYQFQFKKDSYIGNQEKSINEITWYISLESKPVGSKTLEDVLGNSKVFNLVFVSEDLWRCHATVIKRESVDMDMFPFKCLAGEGACPSSLFERTSLFNEAYMIKTNPNSDPDAVEEVDAFLKDSGLYVNGQWPGKFDLDAANKRLDDLKERMKDELKEYANIPETPFDEVSNVDEINPNWTSDWMKDVDTNTEDNIEQDLSYSELESATFDSLVELFEVNNVPCNDIDFDKKDINQLDFDALFKAMMKSPDPQMRNLLEELIPMAAQFRLISMMEKTLNPDNNKKTTEKKTKSKKTSRTPKTSKKKKSDDNDDNK